MSGVVNTIENIGAKAGNVLGSFLTVGKHGVDTAFSAFGDTADLIDSAIERPKPPDVSPVVPVVDQTLLTTPMPTQEQAVAAARRRTLQELASRRGRAATVLTGSGEKLGA